MCSKRSACLIVHKLLCIAVVSTNKHRAIYFNNRLNCFSNALVNCLNRLDCGIFHTSMPYHIRVCKINYNNIIAARFYRFCKLIAYCICTHLWLQVIRCHLFWRRHQNSVLALIWFFHATIKEKCNMCVFFCLCNSCLCHIVCSKPLAKCIGHRNLVECNDLIWYRRIII